MIDLYFWPTPNGWKVSIALEEMGLPYGVSIVDIRRGDQFNSAFLEIAPNNRIPAIIDPMGPGGEAIAIFESGAILLYLVRKSGLFGWSNPRQRASVEQWLMWQMGGLGPMAGQAHHFIKYAPKLDPPQDLPYPKDRYRAEVARLYSVLDRQLTRHEYVAGDDYTIADMAIWPWASLWKGQEQTLEDKPHLARWLDLVGERPAVQRGRALHQDLRDAGTTDKEAQSILFKR
jgi:GST-like protein